MLYAWNWGFIHIDHIDDLFTVDHKLSGIPLADRAPPRHGLHVIILVAAPVCKILFLEVNVAEPDIAVIVAVRAFGMPFFLRAVHIIRFNRDKTVTPETIIPVEKIHAPILLLSSKNDEVWPSYESSIFIEKRLREHGFTYPVKHVDYEHMSHAMMTGIPWGIKLVFKTERQHPVECKTERKNMSEELIAWVKRF